MSRAIQRSGHPVLSLLSTVVSASVTTTVVVVGAAPGSAVADTETNQGVAQAYTSPYFTTFESCDLDSCVFNTTNWDAASAVSWQEWKLSGGGNYWKLVQDFWAMFINPELYTGDQDPDALGAAAYSTHYDNSMYISQANPNGAVACGPLQDQALGANEQWGYCAESYYNGNGWPYTDPQVEVTLYIGSGDGAEWFAGAVGAAFPLLNGPPS